MISKSNSLQLSRKITKLFQQESQEHLNQQLWERINFALTLKQSPKSPLASIKALVVQVI